MGFWAIVLLIAGAVILGFIGQALGGRRFDYEWVAIAVGGFAGGYLGALTEWGWTLNELYVFPALIGAVVIGGLVKLVISLTTPAREIVR